MHRSDRSQGYSVSRATFVSPSSAASGFSVPALAFLMPEKGRIRERQFATYRTLLLFALSYPFDCKQQLV